MADKHNIEKIETVGDPVKTHICIKCGGKTIRERRLHISVYICETCGEQYLDEQEIIDALKVQKLTDSGLCPN